MAYLMGIDIGSTSIKAVIYDKTGAVVSQGSRPTVLSHIEGENPAWAVWQPEIIWDAVCGAVRQALSSADKFEVAAVAVTGFGMDGLPVSADGTPLYPFISWHCTRTNETAQEFSHNYGQKKIFGIAGTQLMPIHSVYRMIWMRKNHPEVIENTEKWLLIEDYINYRLCGVMATDYSMAWNTSVLDQKEGRWSDELIEAAGVPRRIFPEIRQSGTFLGGVEEPAARDTGLLKGTKVVLGGHDYICAALAAGAYDSSIVMDVTGTWEMVLQSSSKLSHRVSLFNSGYYVQNHVAKEKFCFVASAVCGDMAEWLKNNLSYEELALEKETGTGVWDILMGKAKQSPAGANGCFFLPHFSGAGAPVMDPDSLGAYIGLSNSVNKNDIIRATIEGLNYQFYGMLEALEEALGISPEKVVAVGGATKNEFWMQNKADICGKPIEVSGIYEATSLGAAMLAGIGTGVYTSEEEAVKSVARPGVVFEPDRDSAARYAEYYHEIFKNIYGALRGINHEIARRF